MTADQSTPPRTSRRWTRIVLIPVGVVLMLIGASQVFAWTAYKLGALPMGLWQVLEHGGFNGVLGENLGAAIGRGLAWAVGFVIVSVVMLGIVRRRAAHRLPVGVVVLGTVLVMSWAFPGSAGLTHDDARHDFHTLRPALGDVVERAERGDLDGPYAELPRALDFVSVTGSVDVYRAAGGPDAVTIFVPQWARLVDDAGGYIYSPHRRPDINMRGMACTAPDRLDEGWWSC
ncbi:hypothetical protein [Promicromonospora sp. NPDC050249]|uniref:hypothetical protein n=1 Tax=Promicromonospora sp. NPDC050249 TaxID=3154743 RepID=UPI00340A9C2D